MAIGLAAIVLIAPTAQAVEPDEPDPPAAGHEVEDPRGVAGLAVHNGTLIDLSKGWNGATTCIVVPDALTLAECFDSAGDRDERLHELGLTERFADVEAPEGADFAFASCSSYLKLYDGYNYSGTSLWLSTRQTWTNLSVYGFNQRASSYRVGGCSTYMADYSNGGGAWISTSLTQAWDVDAIISGSWNNDVSSVYIL
ncbi:MAG: hypothetical protein AAF480_00680 [Actinomycetota bacterium]